MKRHQAQQVALSQTGDQIMLIDYPQISRHERINQILCLVLLFSSALFPLRILPGNNRIDILLIPMAAFWLIFNNLDNWQNVVKTNRKVLLMLTVFYGWIWIVAGFSPYFKTAIKYNIMYSIYVLIFIAFLLITFNQNPNKATNSNSLYHRAIFNFLCILGFFGVLEYFFPDIWVFQILGSYKYLEYYPQVSSLTQNPNHFAVLMPIGVGLGIILKKQNLINKHHFYLGMFFLFMSIALAASRNACIVFLLLMILGCVYKIFSIKEAIIYSAILLLTLLFFPIPTYRLGIRDSEIFPLIQFLTDHYIDPAALISDPKSTALSRFVLWKAAIAYTSEHPLTGVGIGVFAEHIGPEVMGRVGLHAHNIFLNVMTETGIPGLLIFLGLLGSIFRQTNLKNGRVTIFIILLLVSQLPDFFVADFTFMIVAVYFFAIACNSNAEQGDRNRSISIWQES